ncbi:hypothetical protein IJH19_01540 [Candidatus Saccharibacteria bacterium]|nr:hypothetical protein [Candidatus Saccharibacteria bacterium]
MNKKSLVGIGLAATWGGLITAPYIYRTIKRSYGARWDGYIETCCPDHKLSSDIGYFFVPGVITPPYEDIIRMLDPYYYDLNIVHHGNCYYEPKQAAIAIAAHIREYEYKYVRIITYGLGDQVLKSLGSLLSDRIKNGTLEIIVYNGTPNSDFVKDLYVDILRHTRVPLKFLRILSGWLAELPMLYIPERESFSPAAILEQLLALSSYENDYIDRPIQNCIVAVAKTTDHWYDADSIEDLFSITFNSNSFVPPDDEEYLKENHIVYFSNSKLPEIIMDLGWQL